jgi:hypothetical protein
MRISGSTCPLNAADTDTFKAQWAAHRGYTADITGVVSIYSGNFYLQPCDANAVVYKSLPQLSEAEKVAYEKDNLELDVTKFADGAEVSLFRNLFEDQPIDLGGDRFLAEYRRYNWQPWVESYLRNCSKSALEAALRFGMVICASDGFIRDEERERILRWT